MVVKYKVQYKNDRTEDIEGEIQLFNDDSFPTKPRIDTTYLNVNLIKSIKPYPANTGKEV